MIELTRDQIELIYTAVSDRCMFKGDYEVEALLDRVRQWDRFVTLDPAQYWPIEPKGSA